MLNCNEYGTGEGRFQHGVFIEAGHMAVNRYHNGEIRAKLSLLTIGSPGTGHWPFSLFDLSFLTGEMSAWQLTVLGFTVGSKRMHDIDEEGMLQGPDFKKFYFFFGCINHQHKLLEEII